MDTKRDQFDYFRAIYEQVGVAQLNEGGHNITWMHDALFPGLPSHA